jgi:hypothetical protein
VFYQIHQPATVAIWHIAKNAGIHRFEWVKKQRPPSYEKMRAVAFFRYNRLFSDGGLSERDRHAS